MPMSDLRALRGQGLLTLAFPGSGDTQSRGLVTGRQRTPNGWKVKSRRDSTTAQTAMLGSPLNTPYFLTGIQISLRNVGEVTSLLSNHISSGPSVCW